jgi:glycosyltransferase involved in cell wall biosynthesis
MSIRVLNISYRADMGGGPKYVENLLHSLTEVPEVVSFSCSRGDQEFAQKFQTLSQDFFALKPFPWTLLQYFSLRSFLKKNQINLIHTHGRGALLVAKLLIPKKIPFIHTCHGIHTAPGLKGTLKQWLEQWAMKRVDTFLTTSQSELDAGVRVGFVDQIKAKVFYTCVNHHEKTEDTGELQRKFQLPENAFVLGSIARADKIKNLDFMVKCIQNQADYHLFLAGLTKNDFLELYPKQATERVYFLGRLEKPLSFYPQLDVYINTSTSEGMPLTVLEAMASGTACVLSDVQGNNEFYHHAKFFQLNNQESFLQCLQEYQDEKERNKMAQKALELISTRHSTKNWTKTLVETYAEQTAKISPKRI